MSNIEQLHLFNVEETVVIRVTIQDLQKPLNTLLVLDPKVLQ